MIDLTVTAQQDGSDESDGMTFGELEHALEQGRAMGAVYGTRLRAVVNRNRRLRTLMIEVRPTDEVPGPSPYGAVPAAPIVAPDGAEVPSVDDGHVPGQTALDEV